MSTDREGAKLGAPARDPEPGQGGAQGHVQAPAQGHVRAPVQHVRRAAKGHAGLPVKGHNKGAAKEHARALVQEHAGVPLQEQAEDLLDQVCSAGMAAGITSAETVNGAVKADRHRGADGGAGRVLPDREAVRLAVADAAVDAAVVGDARPAVNEQQMLNTNE